MIGLVLLISLLGLANAGIFPTVCVPNITVSLSGVCCPPATGGDEPCGGPARGECLPVPADSNGQPGLGRPLYADLKLDDRFNWPSKFVSHACACKDNFYSFDCSQCKFGYRGENCDEKDAIKVRREISRVGEAERAKFIAAVDKIKKTDSGWSAMNVSQHVGFDARNPGNNMTTFHPVSVYDMHVYRHVYAARSSLQEDGTCLKFTNTLDSHVVDWGHFGPGFAPWHRLWMLLVERDLQLASGDPDLGIPYWDWAVEATSCPFCTSEFMGAMNETGDGEVIDSPIATWRIMCQSTTKEDCDFCDPTVLQKRIIRRPGQAEGFPKTPGRDQVDYLLSLSQYDTPPYNDRDVNSFSSILDSTFVFVPPYDFPTLHAQIHIWMDGTLTDGFTITPNDPIFLLHHSQVDRLYEAWINKYQPSKSDFPGWDAAIGHAAKDPIVPFFPPEHVEDYFALSQSFGYTFDDVLEGNETLTETPEYTTRSYVGTSPDTSSTCPARSAHVGYVMWIAYLISLVLG